METLLETDEGWMRTALAEAGRAREAGEVPVGAVIVRNGELLAAAHNHPIALHDPSAHAELLAIRRAAAAAGNYRLPGTTLYVTLEPCLMCAGAILHARIDRLVFGAADPKNGAVVSLYRLFDDRRFNHTVSVTEGVLREACSEILSGFFREKRLTLSPPAPLPSVGRVKKAAVRAEGEVVRVCGSGASGKEADSAGAEKVSRSGEIPKWS